VPPPSAQASPPSAQAHAGAAPLADAVSTAAPGKRMRRVLGLLALAALLGYAGLGFRAEEPARTPQAPPASASVGATSPAVRSVAHDEPSALPTSSVPTSAPTKGAAPSDEASKRTGGNASDKAARSASRREARSTKQSKRATSAQRRSAREASADSEPEAAASAPEPAAKPARRVRLVRDPGRGEADGSRVRLVK
jgi:hypothetical protein